MSSRMTQVSMTLLVAAMSVAMAFGLRPISLSSGEMERSRGSNDGSVRCQESCASYNDVASPCEGKENAEDCNTCSAPSVQVFYVDDYGSSGASLPGFRVTCPPWLIHFGSAGRTSWPRSTS